MTEESAKKEGNDTNNQLSPMAQNFILVIAVLTATGALFSSVKL